MLSIRSASSAGLVARARPPSNSLDELRSDAHAAARFADRALKYVRTPNGLQCRLDDPSDADRDLVLSRQQDEQRREPFT
jgi:hypothetical protein